MKINNKKWNIYLVESTSGFLFKKDKTYSLGCCDKDTYSIYINKEIPKKQLKKVLCHEITHAAMFSYNIYLTHEEEELIAELISNFGEEIIIKTNRIFKKMIA